MTLSPDDVSRRSAELIGRLLKSVAHDLILPPTVRTSTNSAVSLVEDIVSIEVDRRELLARVREIFPDAPRPPLLIEKPVARYSGMLGPAGFTAIRASSAYMAGPAPSAAATLEFHIRGPLGPLQNARVQAFWATAAGELQSAESRTDRGGIAKIQVPADVPVTCVADPAADHWPLVRTLPPGTPTTRFMCPAIRGSTGETWWRDFVGAGRVPMGSGSGITVGVIDTGIGPHPDLGHVESLGAAGPGVIYGFAGCEDVRGHGTHVGGVIGARPAPEGNGRPGLAPDCRLMAIRVFGPDGGTDQAVTAAAIRRSADAGADLVNLSLGAPGSSAIERQEIRAALERGTLCVAAAGNSGGPVDYPAAYRDVVAVAAIGLAGTWMPNTLSAGRMPATAADRGNGGVFGANFSNRGRAVGCHAPGVAIVSTVANAIYQTAGEAVMDGTSMSAPIACGLLAARLSADAKYPNMPPTADRCRHARKLMRDLLAHTGLRTDVWGAGVVRHP